MEDVATVSIVAMGSVVATVSVVAMGRVVAIGSVVTMRSVVAMASVVSCIPPCVLLYMMLSLWWMEHVTFSCTVTSTTDPFTQQPHQPISSTS